MNVNGAVYVQTNDERENEVVAYRRDDGGRLTRLGGYATGGRGTGKPHLPSQGSIAVAADGRRVLAVNAGSDELTLFSVEGDALRLVTTVPSGGSTPTSVAVHGELVYVANNGSGSITGFEIRGDGLEPLADSTRSLSVPDADPAQISFSPDGRTLVVTERGTNSITAFAIDDRGYADGPTTIPSPGQTPYGFDFAGENRLVVTEAFGGAIGKAAASSFALTSPGMLEPVSTSVADTRSEVCWAAATKDGRFVYVTNFGDNTISSYRVAGDGTLELVDAVAAVTRADQGGVRDEAITADGRFLYVLDADAQRVHGWQIEADGRLAEVDSADGLPMTVAGLAAT
jgi:6-phosphogluconolactonase